MIMVVEKKEKTMKVDGRFLVDVKGTLINARKDRIFNLGLNTFFRSHFRSVCCR